MIMARSKEVKEVKEKYAVLKSKRFKKTVKAWQYYSIFDFCRSFGRSKEDANWVAEWCMRAKPGDYLNSDDGFEISIIESGGKDAE